MADMRINNPNVTPAFQKPVDQDISKDEVLSTGQSVVDRMPRPCGSNSSSSMKNHIIEKKRGPGLSPLVKEIGVKHQSKKVESYAMGKLPSAHTSVDTAKARTCSADSGTTPSSNLYQKTVVAA